jgi:ribonucleotide reductase alpha subunit
MKQLIVARNGSIQGLSQIPEEIQARYKTAWELKQKTLIDMAATRGAFICQSQSLNLFVADATYAKLTSMHFYGWKAGLKTGCYYLRTKAPVTAQKFTVDPRLLAAVQGSTHQAVEADSDDESIRDSESEDEQQQKAPLSPKSARRAKLEELARAYEESVQELAARFQRGTSALTMQLHRLREVLAECIGRKFGKLEASP